MKCEFLVKIINGFNTSSLYILLRSVLSRQFMCWLSSLVVSVKEFPIRNKTKKWNTARPHNNIKISGRKMRVCSMKTVQHLSMTESLYHEYFSWWVNSISWTSSIFARFSSIFPKSTLNGTRFQYIEEVKVSFD